MYFQTELSNSDKIEKILRSYLSFNSYLNNYSFFLNYNSGLISISNSVLLEKWQNLIDLDNDQIFISIPYSPGFISIEKTEDIIVDKELNRRQWIYEVTFSNKEIKKQVLASVFN